MLFLVPPPRVKLLIVVSMLAMGFSLVEDPSFEVRSEPLIVSET